VDYVIRSGDEGFVGVLAQLITIDDDRLARVAAAAMRTLLAVVVVKDADARARLVATLSAKKYPTPDVLALTHVAAYRGPKTGDIPGFTGAGETAQALVRAACAGSDPPLPLSLPHHKAGSRDKNLDWPQGCLGHLCNLVRPAQRGQRATVVYGLLSGTLVFETLNDALAYREHVTQTLRLPCGSEMVSLDMGRVSGRGIISGSNFRPPPLDKADFVMGSAPCGGSDGEGGRVEAMRGWIEVLREKEHAEAALADAQEKVAAEEACCRPELDDLEGQIAEVDAQIQCLRSPSGGTKQRRGGGGEAADGKEVAVENGEDEGNQGKGKAKRRRLVRGG